MSNPETYFPFWRSLTSQQQSLLSQAAVRRHAEKGRVLHDGSGNCTGLLIVVAGRLRIYTLSEEGKEITLYRLLERDICLFSASCMFRSIQFEVAAEAETACEYLHIPSKIYEAVMKESAAAANYTNELMAARFSDVMWLMNQILYKKMDARLAAFLLEEAALSGSLQINMTHEEIARHLGSAREVISRMLKYFTGEGVISMFRGGLSILDEDALSQIAEADE